MSKIKPEAFDLVVIGSGEGGKFLAWTLGRKGRKVAVVERRWVGGSCPNIACLPSKNVIHSAKVASYFFRSEEFGISKDHVRIDLSGVRERKRRMVAGLVDMHHSNFRQSGAELIMGFGRFIGPRTVEVALPDGNTRVLRGENVVINTGTRAHLDALPGLREAEPLTHVEALELDRTPSHLLLLGAGFVGLELGQAFRRFGAEVTIVDRNERIIHREDPDVSDSLHEALRHEGIRIVTQAQVARVEGRSGQRVKLYGTAQGADLALEGSDLLVASGRIPNTEGLGLPAAGVETTAEGFIKVNERRQATAQGIWAIGDCAGGPHYTHVSFDDFRVVRDNLLGGNHVTTGRQIPSCLFTDPELAQIGLSETEAKARSIPYRLAKIPMAADLRTRTLSETQGFMKALVAADSDLILGFTMFGVMAGEVMATVQVAMLADLPYTVLRDAVFAHPTMLEGLITLFSAVPPRGD